MTSSYSVIASPQQADEDSLSAAQLTEAQKQQLIKIWVGCYTLCHRIYGPGHSVLSDLNTIKANYRSGITSAIDAQKSCYTILKDLQISVGTQVANGDWELQTEYNPTGNILPGPFASDTAAAAAGVEIGALYKKDGGQVNWRVS